MEDELKYGSIFCCVEWAGRDVALLLRPFSHVETIGSQEMMDC